jgi:hypothetical protein
MAAGFLSIPPDVRRRIDTELLDDEEILWTGQDGPNKAPPASVILLTAAFLPTMFFALAGWLVMQWLAVMGYLLLGVAGFCLVFPVIILAARARARNEARLHCWALTDRGLLGVPASADGETIRVQAHQIETFGMSAEPDGRGTFVIDWRDRALTGDVQLTCVADADKARDILRRLAPGKEEEL